jgi:hypothetical protein
MTNGCQMIWFLFGSGHGKGSHDGAFVVIKRFLKREHLNAHKEKLQNANDVVTFMKKLLSYRIKTSYNHKRKLLKRFFWLVKLDDVIQNNTSFNCDHVKRTMKLHSIWVTYKHNLTQLLLRNLFLHFLFGSLVGRV